MPDAKITALTSIGTSTDPANDPLVIVDVSDTSMAATGTTKKVTLNQLLGASGTATLASATITGDLTVATSVLKVDTANTRVGINTTSINGGPFNVKISPTIDAKFVVQDGFTTGNVRLAAVDNAYSTYKSMDYSALSHAWYNSGSTAMTLNSTGLGVGVSPSYKFDVLGSATISGRFKTSGALNALYLEDGGTTPGSLYIGTSGDTFRIITGSNVRMNVDVNGQIGVGVVPSAWSTSASRKAIQLSTAGSISAQDTGTAPYTFVASNWVSTATGDQYILGAAAPATLYRQFNGTHSWFNAPSGTGALTFTQAMTLDASGNLLVKKTAQDPTVIGFEAQSNGTVNSTLGSAVNANATFAVYSTGAAAYRFYVGMGGTVYATNTTISAISDARLKENVQDIDVGLGAILALKPRKFDWKAGKGKDIKGDRGFIAQEFEQVFPQLVDEWKDEAPEGEAPYKSVRQDLIPVLVKAIQELAARVQTLETR